MDLLSVTTMVFVLSFPILYWVIKARVDYGFIQGFVIGATHNKVTVAESGVNYNVHTVQFMLTIVAVSFTWAKEAGTYE